MRPDVKLGIVISLVVVVVAGGYYVYRDARDVPIPVSGGPADLADAKNTTAGKPAPAVPAAGRRTNRDRSTMPGGAARAHRRSANRANPSAQPGVTAPAQSQPNRTASTPRNNTRKPSTGSPNNERVANQGKVAPNGAMNARRASANRRSGAAPPRTGSGSESTAPRAHRTAIPKASAGTAGAETPTAAQSTRQATAGGDRAAHRARPPHSPGRRGGTSLTSRSTGQEAGVPVANMAVETHRLQPGDTLAGLSMAYYGSERHVPMLLAANPQISDPSRLRVGAIIKIPPAPNELQLTPADQTPSGNPPSQAAPQTSRSYTVKPGDSFYAIAESQLGSSSRWEEVFELNKKLVNGDPKRLQVGQVIVLPE